MLFLFANLFDWLSHRFCRGPSKNVHTTECSRRFDFINSTPLRQSFRFTINRYFNVAAHVVSLLFRCRPTAIFRRVIAIVINTVNRMFPAWFWSHVIVKILERFNPAVTNFYSATAVIFPVTVFFIAGSILYMQPHIVSWIVCSALFIAMLIIFIDSFISNITSTRFGGARFKGIRWNYDFIPTLTKTIPSYNFSDVFSSSNYSESFKNFTGEIYKINWGSFFRASTRSNTATSKRSCGNYRFISTIATTQPSGLISFVVHSFNCGKFSKFLASEIYKGGHDSYPPLDIPYLKVWRADTDFSLSPVGLATLEV